MNFAIININIKTSKFDVITSKCVIFKNYIHKTEIPNRIFVKSKIKSPKKKSTFYKSTNLSLICYNNDVTKEPVIF